MTRRRDAFAPGCDIERPRWVWPPLLALAVVLLIVAIALGTWWAFAAYAVVLVVLLSLYHPLCWATRTTGHDPWCRATNRHGRAGRPEGMSWTHYVLRGPGR